MIGEPGAGPTPSPADPAVESVVAQLLMADPDDPDGVLRAAESLHQILGDRLRDLGG